MFTEHRIITRLQGQPNGAYIRPINLYSFLDRAAVVTLCHNLPREFGYSHNPPAFLNDVINDYPSKQSPHSSFMYALSDFDYKNPYEMLGFVGLFPIQPEDMQALITQDAVSKTIPTQIFEIAYTKLDHAPARMVSNGLRLALVRLCQQEAAYDDQQDNSKTKPTSLVVAYVKPKNNESIQLLEAVGFKKYENAENEKNNRLAYILDWDAFHKSIQERADNLLIKEVA